MQADGAGLAAWRSARRILCVRLDNLGDVLMTTPAMRALKLANADRHLTLLGSHAGAALAPYVPEIDAVLRYDAPWVSHPRDAGFEADFRIIERLAMQHFDAAVIFTVFSQSPLPAAAILRLAGIPLIAAHCRENPYRLLSDWIRETETGMPNRHEVQRQLDLVATLGTERVDERLSFRITEHDRGNFSAKLRAQGIADDEPYLLAHPGATAASRRYPVELFAAALQALERAGWRIVLGGSAEDRDLALGIRAQLSERAVIVAGELSLGECAASIERASLLIANNSGAVHLAAAIGTPVVDLYAQTNPQHTPWQVPNRVLFHDVECRWCYRSICTSGHHGCLRGVSPEAVASAAFELLAEHRPQHHSRGESLGRVAA